MNLRVDALCTQVSKLRQDLTEAAREKAALRAQIASLQALVEDLGHRIGQRDVELARIRQEWIPRRVHEACLRIDHIQVREYAK